MAVWCRLYVLVFLIVHGILQAMNNDTTLFIKKFSAQEIIANAKNSEIFFEHALVSPCNHIIVSWNIFYPSKGYFSLFAQVKHSGSSTWQEWHHLADWSEHIRRSYTNQVLGSSFHHVRLEIPWPYNAQAFRIKVIGNQGANLSNVRALVVNAVDMHQFEGSMSSASYDLSSVMVHKVPCHSQMTIDHPRAQHMCSPTSLSMLLGYLHPYRLDTLSTALAVYDTGLDTFGSWPFNTAYAYNHCKGKFLFYVARLASFKNLHALLLQNMPVIVSVRGTLKGAAKEYNNGHLLVVVGWNHTTQHVICHDPAFDDSHNVRIEYPIQDFIKAWNRSHNLAYISQPF